MKNISDLPNIREGAVVLQAQPSELSKYASPSEAIYASQIRETVAALKNQKGLAESSLEMYPGSCYWSEQLTSTNNKLKDLGALEMPAWVGQTSQEAV